MIKIINNEISNLITKLLISKLILFQNYFIDKLTDIKWYDYAKRITVTK